MRTETANKGKPTMFQNVAMLLVVMVTTQLVLVQADDTADSTIQTLSRNRRQLADVQLMKWLAEQGRLRKRTDMRNPLGEAYGEYMERNEWAGRNEKDGDDWRL